MKLLPTGNIEMTVQLLPEVYAALTAVAVRESLRDRLVQVEHTVPPADVVPGALVLDDTPMSVELEHTARVKHAARLVHRTLLAESLKERELRNTALVDLCLEVRAALQPSAPGPQLLREVTPVGIRHAVQVPGGAM